MQSAVLLMNCQLWSRTKSRSKPMPFEAMAGMPSKAFVLRSKDTMLSETRAPMPFEAKATVSIETKAASLMNRLQGGTT